jgi:hypothetical protein
VRLYDRKYHLFRARQGQTQPKQPQFTTAPAHENKQNIDQSFPSGGFGPGLSEQRSQNFAGDSPHLNKGAAHSFDWIYEVQQRFKRFETAILLHFGPVFSSFLRGQGMQVPFRRGIMRHRNRVFWKDVDE